jgi:putative ABC transport system ATP-binding protein
VEENRRSGIDRRADNGDTTDERRQSERRSLLNTPEEVLNRLKSISMFKGLTDDQLSRMVSICSRRKYAPGELIYKAGDEANEMFILLRGKISIKFGTGVELRSIVPTGTVGEMGVFTGEPRSATVEADTECNSLNFNKTELLMLFRTDMELWIKIQANIIRDLSHKVRKDNEIIEELMYRVRSLEIL